MSLIISTGIAVMFACGFYLLLKKGLMNRAMGLLIIANGANWLLITMAGMAPTPLAPLLQQSDGGRFADPLPQALILTALVIGFGIAAFLWTLLINLGKEEPSS